MIHPIVPREVAQRLGPLVRLVVVAAVLGWSASAFGAGGQEIPAAQPAGGGAANAPAYRIEPPPADARTLDSRFEPSQIEILEMLNRADRAHLPKLDALVVPVDWLTPLAYAPFPQRYDWRADAGKVLVIHQPGQAFAAYESGVLVRWGPVSTGREKLPTPSGLLHLNWRSRGRHSTVDPDWYMPWYFNIHNERGISIHQYALPGYPASHACVRMLERDAQWLFEWGETWTLDERGWNVLDHGTPVPVVGCYAFDQPPPWRSLDWLAQGITLPASPQLELSGCR